MGNTRHGEKVMFIGIIGLILSFYVSMYGMFIHSQQIVVWGIIGLSLSFIVLPIALRFLGGEVHNG